MQTMELTIQPSTLTSIERLPMADAFIIGEADYALRLPFYPSHEEVLNAIKTIKANGQKVYLAVNKILHEYELEQVTNYLNEMKGYDIDGFIFGDLAVYKIAESLGLVSRLIYNPETYITNYMSANFFKGKGIKRISIAKEITLEDIEIFGKNVDMEFDVLGHGAVNMFHSKRNLVTNYFRFIQDEQPDAHHEEQLYLVEEKRKDKKYPIVEDHNGTHIYRETDLCTIEYLDVIANARIKSLRIDGLFKEDEALITIVEIYRQALDDLHQGTYEQNKTNYVQALNEIPNLRPFDTGFLFKKTIYKG